MSRRLAAYFGRRHVPGLTLQAPHTQAIETSGAPPRLSGGEGDVSVGVRRLSVMLLSYEDGRDSIVDLTKTLADMCQRGKLAPGDISMDLVDAELTENVMGEPDLLVLFGPYVDLAGYPPWQLRLTEIFHVRDNHSVGYQVFLRGLYKFANAEMRLGR